MPSKADVSCTTCGKPLLVGQLRRHQEHFECWQARDLRLKELISDSRRVLGVPKQRNNRPPDIKAPDGFVLGGTRKVNKDGTIRLSGSFYQCPVEWAGKWLSCHINNDGTESIDVAMDEGLHVFSARVDHKNRLYVAPYTSDKPDPVNRTARNIDKLYGRA